MQRLVGVLFIGQKFDHLRMFIRHYHNIKYHYIGLSVLPLSMLWITRVNASNNNSVDDHESIYFPEKEVHSGVEPHANATYNLNFPFSSIINGYKMAEVPSPTILRELFHEELNELNKFHERKMIDHKFIHNKEYMRFHVILKPFSWLENIPLINYIFDIKITANEDWIIDWKKHRAECLITNESLRWTFSVDELVIIQGLHSNQGLHSKIPTTTNRNITNRNITNTTKLYKALYISTFIPIPSIMFLNYKKYSDSYINVISKLAAFRCNSSSSKSN